MDWFVCELEEVGGPLSKIFDEMMRGLRDVEDFMAGERDGFQVHDAELRSSKGVIPSERSE